MADDARTAALAARLREAREYIGLSREDTASALRCSALLIEAMENGTPAPGPEMLERLADLYQRPVTWFTCEFQFTPSPDLLQLTENLLPGDREAILDFAEFLQGAGRPPRPHREMGGDDA